jgi:heme A synthase
MGEKLKPDKFAKFAWFVLAYNVVVILWGVFLRASKSGDGCGQHWLTCHGEVVPSAPELKTVIEFSHRITSALDGFIVIGLLVWIILRWRAERSETNSRVLKMAIASFVFVIIEGLLGAGLVLTGNTAENLTAARPFWMAGHLLTTLILLTFLTLTAWFASGGKPFSFNVSRQVKLLLWVGIFGFLLVGMSGSVAALSTMIFPSASLAEGVAKDFSETSNILLRLRVFHPILSVAVGVFLIFLSGWIRSKASENAMIKRCTNILSILVLVQIGWGALTFLTLAPIVMQLVHLFLADAIWITFVLMTAGYLSLENEPEVIAGAMAKRVA